MYKKALVTGGAGFIGSNIVKELLKEGLEVTVLDDLSMGKIENVPEDAEFIEGNVCSQDDVNSAIKDVDIIFHEAARVSIRSSMDGFYKDAETNLMGTINLLRCCRDSSVKKLIFASSMAIYSDCDRAVHIDEDYMAEPISPYGISKLASEKYCLQISESNGIDCHILRYFNTFGAGQALTPYVGVITIFINALLEGNAPTIYGDGEQRRDFIHVSDIVRANILAMKSNLPDTIFNVGTGIDTSVNEIAQLLCDKINPSIKPVHVDAQAGELRNSIADITNINEKLGFSAKSLLHDKIDEVIEYYKNKKLS